VVDSAAAEVASEEGVRSNDANSNAAGKTVAQNL